MRDTTPIPGPSRGLSGSANLTVLLKFVLDQPLLPWQRKFENFNGKLAINGLVWETRPPFLHLGGVRPIGVGEFNCASEICAIHTYIQNSTLSDNKGRLKLSAREPTEMTGLIL